MKYDLSIVTPAAPGRLKRVESLINRLVLNKKTHPNIKFELILIENHINKEYKEICTSNKNLDIKYICVPIDHSIYKYPNPAYMRNCAFRLAEGEYFCLCDVDWYLSENFIKGAINCQNSDLNVGYVIDSSKGFHAGIAGIPVVDESNPIIKNIIKYNNCIMENSSSLLIDDAYKMGNIPRPSIPSAVWMWSTNRSNFLYIHGYDEKFCKLGYGCEDDSLFYRLSNLCKLNKNNYMEMCGIHLHHSQSARGSSQKTKEHLQATRYTPIQNILHEWGKLTKDSLIIMNNQEFNFNEIESWIESNIKDLHPYKYSWENFGELVTKC